MQPSCLSLTQRSQKPEPLVNHLCNLVSQCMGPCDQHCLGVCVMVYQPELTPAPLYALYSVCPSCTCTRMLLHTTRWETGRYRGREFAHKLLNNSCSTDVQLVWYILQSSTVQYSPGTIAEVEDTYKYRHPCWHLIPYVPMFQIQDGW